MPKCVCLIVFSWTESGYDSEFAANTHDIVIRAVGCFDFDLSVAGLPQLLRHLASLMPIPAGTPHSGGIKRGMDLTRFV
jgi:hypothetical protein